MVDPPDTRDSGRRLSPVLDMDLIPAQPSRLRLAIWPTPLVMTEGRISCAASLDAAARP